MSTPTSTGRTTIVGLHPTLRLIFPLALPAELAAMQVKVVESDRETWYIRRWPFFCGTQTHSHQFHNAPTGSVTNIQLRTTSSKICCACTNKQKRTH